VAAVRNGAQPDVRPQLREAFPRLRQLEKLDRGYVDRLEGMQLRARHFADLHLRDVAQEVDERTGTDPSYFDWDLVRTGGKHGMLDFLLPAEIGGGGCLTVECSVVMEELCSACPGLALIFGAHGLGISPLLLDAPSRPARSSRPSGSARRAVAARSRGRGRRRSVPGRGRPSRAPP